MEKMDSASFNVKEFNIGKLKELFPNIVTEGKIDFDLLRTMLGDEVDDSRERYQFTWSGKQNSIKIAQMPSTSTLRPCKSESKNWETTENLYIEGDNLEVLKQLQKTYFNRIKMIYIDPPYNTGKDFVYKDDFKTSLENYKKQTQQNSSNLETSGRYHTDWLNLMYSRLLLAKNLLKDDGVIFISIDDHEFVNLKKICDEIFGERNLVEVFYIQVRYGNKSLNEKDDFQKLIEQVLIYAKDKKSFKPSKPYDEYDLGKFCWNITELSNGEELILGDKKVTLFKPGEFTINEVASGIGNLKETWASGSVLKGNNSGKFFDKFLSKRISSDGYGCLYKVEGIGEDGLGYRYFTGPKKVGATKGKFYSGVPLSRLEELKNGGSKKYKPIINFYDYSADFGNISHEGNVVFRDGKKPIKMISNFMEIANLQDNDIVMDFFSGSASTAHAVMQSNLTRSTSNKFILVQLPEEYEEESEYFNLGFKNICELGKERIRRAGEKLELDNRELELFNSNQLNLDTGFKVFKLDSSNIKAWDSEIKVNEDELLEFSDTFKPDRSEEDILYEIMLKYGVFDKSVEKDVINGKNIYRVGKRYMVICLADDITPSDVEAIAALSPKSVIFKDSGFTSDNDKINAVYNLRKAGVEDIKSI